MVPKNIFLHRSIEANIRETCSDLLKDCVVVGNWRPSPALFVEVLDHTASGESLKETILERIKGFNGRRFSHERIEHKELIAVVASGDLPRTVSLLSSLPFLLLTRF